MALQDDILQLAELDRQVVQALIENNTEEFLQVLGSYLETRSNLKREVLDESVVSVEDATAREILRRITNGDGLQSDEIVERLGGLGGGELAVGELDDAEVEDLGSELFCSWYSHHEYVRALAELRPLILRSSVSESVKRLVGQIKSCYAFQQYDAVFGLCRTLIEASIRDICVRRELVPKQVDDAALLEKYNWKCLRDKVSCGPLNEELKDLYGRLSEVLHARRSAGIAEVRKIFGETLRVIERLYESHGL